MKRSPTFLDLTNFKQKTKMESKKFVKNALMFKNIKPIPEHCPLPLVHAYVDKCQKSKKQPDPGLILYFMDIHILKSKGMDPDICYCTYLSWGAITRKKLVKIKEFESVMESLELVLCSHE